LGFGEATLEQHNHAQQFKTLPASE